MSALWFPALVRFFEVDGTESVKVCLTADDIPNGARFRVLEIRVDIDSHRADKIDSSKKNIDSTKVDKV